MGRRLLLWAIILPLIIGLSLMTGDWLVDAHRYDLPLAAFAHVLFALGGLALMTGRIDDARWLTVPAAAMGMLSGVIVMGTEVVTGHPDSGPLAGLALQLFVLVAHGIYVVVNLGLLAMALRFRGPPPPASRPAAAQKPVDKGPANEEAGSNS